MARDSRTAFLRALAQVEPQIARAFAEAIQDVRSAAQAQLIEQAIQRAMETRDIATGVREVLAALQLGQEFFAPLDRAIQSAFEAGAAYQLSTLPPKPFGNTAPRLVVRFQGRNPRAEAWTRDHAAALITEIARDTEVMIRQTLTQAVEASRPYRRVTRDLIGTTQGNQRVGGMIGLHSSQANAVINARAELDALDPAYFNRARRDRRLDPLVRRAIREGNPLAQADLDRATARYSDRLLQLRGENIARTEAGMAINAGRSESIEQMIEAGTIPASAVSKIWDSTPSSRTRDSHRELGGTEVPWGQPFISPVTGAVLDRPHDPNAPASETVNCRCSMRVRVDWTQAAR